jgi:cytochrome o ubiquinol oxidase operon protein cyoD
MSVKKFSTGAGSRLNYIIGFTLSLGLTLTAFWLVHKHVANGHQYPSDKFMVTAVMALAIVQLIVQLVYFLHLDRESKPRWNLGALLFMLMVLLIIVIGSLWIMSNLNYRMLGSPTQVNQYIQSQDGL